MQNTKFSFKIALVLLLLVTGFVAGAQKLPGTQKISLRAPANIKVDGKATEWNGQFQAYNSATNIFYTVANDDENLYLAVQATDPLVVRKILNGGITFKIDNTNSVAVTYPVFTQANRPFINLKDKPSGSKADKKELDSFVYVINNRFADRSKYIKVQGIPSITDSLISIYGEDGIKAAVRFVDKAAYNYELAIPLKYYGNAAKFKYSITLNGSPLPDGVTVTRDANGSITRMTVLIGKGAPSATSSEQDMLTTPTYLKGEYALAVK